MNIYIFGRSIVRAFYPELDEKPFNLPTQNPAIYVFDTQPTEDDAQNGTGAISTVTSWTAGDTPPYPRIYTLSAISDPEPDGSTWCRQYWEAINFKLVSGGDTLTHIRAFDVRRMTATDDALLVGKDDVLALFPNIGSYISDSDLEILLPVANDHVRRDLKKKGKDWYQFRNHSELKMAVCYKVISLQGLSSIKDPGDRHTYRFEQFEKWYQEEISSIILPYDSNNDGLAETKEPARTTTQMLYR